MKRVVILVVLFVVFSGISLAKEVDVPETYTVEKGGVLGESATTYIYAGSKLLATKTGEELDYHYQDRLGSDVDSNALPFGQEIVNGERFSFTGKELDESGLHFFDARYYDSDLGKFISVDPVEGELAYGYVMNNPMNLVDPDGKASVEGKWRAFDVGFGAAFALGAGIWRGDSIGDIVKNTAITAGASALTFEAKRMIGANSDHSTQYHQMNIDFPTIFFGRVLGDVSSSIAGNAIGNRDPFSFIQFGMGPANLNIENGDVDFDLDVGGASGFLTTLLFSKGNYNAFASLASYSPVFSGQEGREYGVHGLNSFGNIFVSPSADQSTLNHELIHSIQYSQSKNYFRGLNGGVPIRDNTGGLGLFSLFGFDTNIPGDFSGVYGKANVVRGSLDIYTRRHPGLINTFNAYYSDTFWWERQAFELTGDPLSSFVTN